jgi:hypothetical protein
MVVLPTPDCLANSFVLTSEEGQQSFVRGRTRISFQNGIAAPKRLDLILLAPPLARAHFHLLPYLAQPSRLQTHYNGPDDLIK